MGKVSIIISIIQKYLLNGKDFYLKLLTLAFPIIIQNLIASSLNMVDTVMIGSLGETEIAAVGIANQFFLLFNLIIIGIHSGCSVFFAQFWGQGERKGIRKVLALGLFLSLLVSLVFTILALYFSDTIMAVFSKDKNVITQGSIYLKAVSISYLFTAISFGYSMASRSIGNAIAPLAVSALALICNTLLNYILIFGNFGAPVLAVKGAAIATTIARIIEMLLIVIIVRVNIDPLRIKWADIKDLSSDFIGKVLKTILPVVLNEGCWALGFVVYSVVYGRISTKAFTAVQITNTINNLFIVAIFGIASAASVMVGHRIGEGNEEEGEAYAWKFSIISIISGLLIGGLLAAASPLILSLFNISAEVWDSALRILYITAIIMPIRVFNIVHIIGVLRGGGDVKFSFIAEAITMWCIGVPLAFIGAFVFNLPVEYVVTLVMLEELVKFTVIIRRLLSKQWIKNLIHDM